MPAAITARLHDEVVRVLNSAEAQRVLLDNGLEPIANTPALPTRERPLAAVVDEVVAGFATEARLGGFTVRAEFPSGAASSAINGHDIVAGLSGALIATIPLVESAADGAIGVTVSAAGDGSTIFLVTPGPASIPNGVAHRFFDESSSDRPGGWCAVAGALAAKAFAERHRGNASCEIGSDGRGGGRRMMSRGTFAISVTPVSAIAILSSSLRMSSALLTPACP